MISLLYNSVAQISPVLMVCKSNEHWYECIGLWRLQSQDFDKHLMLVRNLLNPKVFPPLGKASGQ